MGLDKTACVLYAWFKDYLDLVGYEIFESKSTRIGKPGLSIKPNGAMRLNADAGRLLKDQGAEYVLLLWDKSKHRMAISAAPKSDARTYKLKYDSRGSGSGATFAAKAFAKHIGWSSDRAIMLPVKVSAEMLEVTLPRDNLHEP